MRKLMWFTIGFAGACITGIYLLSGIWLVLIALSCFLAGGVFCLYRKKIGLIVLVITVGFGAGVTWLHIHDTIYLETARNFDGKTIAEEIEITDYSWETSYGIAAEGTITLNGKQLHVYVYSKAEALLPGDVVKGEFRLRFTADGGEEEATYHPGKGIFLLAYANDAVTVQRPDSIPDKFFTAKLRRSIQNTLDAVFPEDTAPFARALLLGDSSKLSQLDDIAFKISGIRHVIAVSGLHVTILFTLVYTFAGKHRIITALLGIPVLVLFAAIAGFTPSIVRACIMQCLMILALLLKKEYDSPTALAFAVLVMLLVNPWSITSVSFQLSVGCMVGIFLFSGRISRFLMRILCVPGDKSIRARLGRWFAGGVSVTVSATAVTMPLSAYYFGSISVVGILTNLLTLWIISFAFYGIMFACAIGAVWIKMGTIIAWAVSWALRYVLLVARLLSRLPAASVYTDSIYVLLWLVFCYVLLAAFLWGKRKHPFVFTICVVVGLCLSLVASYWEPKTDDFSVTILDVGQGQSIVIQANQQTFLVDCGGDSGTSAADIAAQHLLSRGITRLDGLILTHYDADHAGGAQSLLYRVPADAIFLPDSTDDGDIKVQLAKTYGNKIQWVTQTTQHAGNWGTFTLFPGGDNKDDNESGLCILFQWEDCDILITGDWSIAQEIALVQSVELPELELLVLGHHGAKTSTSLPLLSATTPKAAVASVDADNAYGHPSQEVLQRLEMFGCRVWRTDLDGTITFGR